MEEELRDAIRKLCERYPDEYWQSLDRERAYPEKFVGELNDAGYLACMIPEEFGGPGLGIREAAVILEEINRSGGQRGGVSRPDVHDGHPPSSRFRRTEAALATGHRGG